MLAVADETARRSAKTVLLNSIKRIVKTIVYGFILKVISFAGLILMNS
jgi:hypothetical protein